MAIGRRLKGKKADQISADLVAAFLYCDRTHTHKWSAPERAELCALAARWVAQAPRGSICCVAYLAEFEDGKESAEPIPQLQVLLVVQFADSFLCLKLARAVLLLGRALQRRPERNKRASLGRLVALQPEEFRRRFCVRFQVIMAIITIEVIKLELSSAFYDFFRASSSYSMPACSSNKSK